MNPLSCFKHDNVGFHAAGSVEESMKNLEAKSSDFFAMVEKLSLLHDEGVIDNAAYLTLVRLAVGQEVRMEVSTELVDLESDLRETIGGMAEELKGSLLEAS